MGINKAVLEGRVMMVDGNMIRIRHALPDGQGKNGVIHREVVMDAYLTSGNVQGIKEGDFACAWGRLWAERIEGGRQATYIAAYRIGKTEDGPELGRANLVSLEGRVSRDPRDNDFFTFPSGKVRNTTPIVHNLPKDERGQDQPLFIDVLTFSSLAERSRIATRGRLLVVDGNFTMDAWEGPEGKATRLYIRADNMLLGSVLTASSQQASAYETPKLRGPVGYAEENDSAEPMPEPSPELVAAGVVSEAEAADIAKKRRGGRKAAAKGAPSSAAEANSDDSIPF